MHIQFQFSISVKIQNLIQQMYTPVKNHSATMYFSFLQSPGIPLEPCTRLSIRKTCPSFCSSTSFRMIRKSSSQRLFWCTVRNFPVSLATFPSPEDQKMTESPVSLISRFPRMHSTDCNRLMAVIWSGNQHDINIRV